MADMTKEVGLLSRRCAENGWPLSIFIGYRLKCVNCKQSFRCFRIQEMECGVCKQSELKLKKQEQ